MNGTKKINNTFAIATAIKMLVFALLNFSISQLSASSSCLNPIPSNKVGLLMHLLAKTSFATINLVFQIYK